MPASCGACSLTLSIRRRMSSELPARMLKPAAPRCRNSAPCVTSMTRSPRSSSLRGRAPLRRSGGSAVPASANNSQIRSALREACGIKAGEAGNCGPRARITECCATVGVRTIGDAEGAGEAGVVQQALPCVLRNAGLVRSDVVVEQPPALEQSEDRGHEQPGTRQFHDHQRPAGAEQLLDPLERLAQVLRGMQDIGGDDHVERMRLESLFERVALDIERPALHERIPGELVLRVRGEARGDVGEHVLGAMFRQNGKDEARSSRRFRRRSPEFATPFLSADRRAISPSAFCTSRLLSRKVGES